MLTALGKAGQMDTQTVIAIVSLFVEILALVIAAFEFGTNYRHK